MVLPSRVQSGLAQRVQQSGLAQRVAAQLLQAMAQEQLSAACDWQAAPQL